MKRNNIMRETDHRRTYNLIRFELHAKCRICGYHGTFFKRCHDIGYVELTYKENFDGSPEKKKYRNHHNWKNFTKNRHQWMPKRYLRRKYTNLDGTFSIELGW